MSESTWDHERVNTRRVELLLADPVTAPHAGGVLVIDDSGDRKDGTATAHVGKQYPGSVGKIDRGVVTVTTCWADERLYHPLHAVPSLREGEGRPRVPHETANRNRSGP
ncbi:transposase (plasmid) [Embleya sp. NBC_00888]|nr:transposase [Embleya sp. NBC_00888]